MQGSRGAPPVPCKGAGAPPAVQPPYSQLLELSQATEEGGGEQG